MTVRASSDHYRETLSIMEQQWETLNTGRPFTFSFMDDQVARINQWLKDFAYRIDVNLLLLIGAGSITLLIALFTISFQSIKAAIASPVNSLRNE